MEYLEEELMEDLFYQEAEGAAEFGEEEEWEGYEAADEFEFGEEEWEAGEEFMEDEFEEEGYDEFDEFEEYAFDEGEDVFEDLMAYAMEADDADEFFGRLIRGIKKIAPKIMKGVRTAGKFVGKAARVAAPIARMIPHPYAQAAATGLNLLGKLRAEGATEEEALEAFAELAAYDEAVRPIVAGLAARSLVKRKGAMMPFPARKKLVKTMNTAAKTLVNRRGPKAVRALPKIVASVKRTAAARRTPVQAAPKIVKRTVAKVTKSKPLTKKLSKPVPKAVNKVRAVIRRVAPMAPLGPMGVGRSFTMTGPVRITVMPI